MELRPILSAMRRNKVGAILIGVQMAITLAILCNALFIIQQRVALSNRPTGTDERNIFVISNQWVGSPPDLAAKEQGDLAALRGLPGVVDAVVVVAVVVCAVVVDALALERIAISAASYSRPNICDVTPSETCRMRRRARVERTDGNLKGRFRRMPITSARLKLCSTSPPKRYRASTVRKVRPAVKIVRLKV